jgi:AhpD family alkylhydroperoxidase
MDGVKIMKQRIDYKKIAPDGFKAMLNLENYVRSSGLEHSLLELVKTRVSQINGCAHCLDMHTKDARAAGETEQRLYVLSAWREAPFYSERERAALAWAEAVTQLAVNDVPDDLYAEVRRQFDEKALVDLTFAIVAINGWNRLAVALRAEIGSYQPKARHAA